MGIERRGRRVKKLVITLLALAGLLVVADFAAAAAAEYRLAQKLQSELRLEEEPSVRIHGFPFLTQAITGHYQRIEMAAEGLDAGPLNSMRVEATLWHVTAPITDVWAGEFDDVRIDRVQGRVRILESDLGQVIGIPDLQIERATGRAARQVLAPRGGPATEQDRAAARMSASTGIVGQRVEVSLIALLELVDGTVQVSPVDVRLTVNQFGAFGLRAFFRELLLSQFRVRVDPGGLPFTVRPTEISVEDGSIVVAGTASDVSFDQAPLSRGD